MYLQISEGSTGDEEPYKGTPTNPQYEISDEVWSDFRHECWDSANAYRPASDQYRLLFNSGNFAQDVQYVDATFPRAMHKNGMLSHWYSFNGELLYYLRQWRGLQKFSWNSRTRGEVQDNFNTSWWKLAPVRNAFTLACSAVSGGLDMMDIGPGYINATLDTRPTDFFKKYAGFRYPDVAKHGFLAFRDVPDFIDTARFPEAEYGPVIAEASLRAFQRRNQNILAGDDSSFFKYWLLMKSYVQFINPVRIANITAEFAPAGAMYTTTDDGYHNDFGINMTKNYAKFVRQIKPDSTSIGAWRIGPDTSMYGRYARMFKIENNKGEMFFYFNEDFVKNGETVKLTVTYYDTADGQWSINGSNKRLKVRNRNTNSWVQRSIALPNFQKNTLFNDSADFSLRYEAGANTPFALLEVEVMPSADKQATPQPEPVAEVLNLKLSPNPNKGRFTVEMNSKDKDSYLVYITNASGNMILSEKRAAIAGSNLWKFSSPNLKEGMYVIHVESSTAKGSANFIVNK